MPFRSGCPNESTLGRGRLVAGSAGSTIPAGAVAGDHDMLRRGWGWTAFVALVGLGACAADSGEKLGRIDAILVIYAENRSLDRLYGLVPGANGVANAAPEQSR